MFSLSVDLLPLTVKPASLLTLQEISKYNTVNSYHSGTDGDTPSDGGRIAEEGALLRHRRHHHRRRMRRRMVVAAVTSAKSSALRGR